MTQQTVTKVPFKSDTMNGNYITLAYYDNCHHTNIITVPVIIVYHCHSSTVNVTH